MSAAARWTARPAIVVERLAPVERSYGREPRVGAADGHLVGLDADLLGGDLRERRPRALAHLGRADEDDHAAVGLEPADRARDRMRAGGEQADRDAAADERLPSARPSRLPPRPSRRRRRGRRRAAFRRRAPPRRACSRFCAAHVERVEAGAAGHLVDLRLADPLQVRRAEGAIGARRREVRVDARRVDAVRRPPVGAGSGVARPSRPRAARCRRRRRCRTGTRRRARAADRRRSRPCASGRSCCGGASSPSTRRRGSGSGPAGRPSARARPSAAPSSCTTSSRSRRRGTAPGCARSRPGRGRGRRSRRARGTGAGRSPRA